MRSVLVLGLAVVGTAAKASFELVMVADNGTGTFASRKIHRFDGDNGVYLGSFGGFGGDIVGTHLNQTTNSLFVYTNDFRLAEYDYNTGALKRAYNTNIGNSGINMVLVRPNETSAVRLDGGDSPLAYSFPNTGGSGSFSASPFGPGMYGGVWLDNDRFLAYNVTNLFEKVVLYSVSPNGLSGTITGSFFADINGISQMTYMSEIDTVVHPAFERLLTYFPSQSAAGFIATPGVENRHSTRAHDGFFTMGRRTGSWSLDKYDRTFGQRGQYGSGIVVNPASMQSVVAPEPGTLLALGVGAAALLRRRRRARA